MLGSQKTHPASGGKHFAPPSFPSWQEAPPLSPEIHRSMVLQISDLNSWVLNQDWGKEQQKLVYRALLRSDGSLWEEAELSISPSVSALRKEAWLSQELVTKFLPTPGYLPFSLGLPPHLRVSLRILLRNQALLSQQSPPSPSTPPQCSNAQCFCTLPRAQPRKQQDMEIYTLHTHASPHDYLPQVGPVELCLTRSHYAAQEFM